MFGTQLRCVLPAQYDMSFHLSIYPPVSVQLWRHVYLCIYVSTAGVGGSGIV